MGDQHGIGLRDIEHAQHLYVARFTWRPRDGHQSTISLDDWDGLYLFAGPGFILECYKKCDTLSDEVAGYLNDDGPYSKFIMHSFESIMEERGNPERDFSKIILDSSNGGDVRCRSAGCQRRNV
jgi:hypothetical protein